MSGSATNGGKQRDCLLDKEQVAIRLRITLHGAVQGVGFRPFVYRLAKELRLCGWVLNSSGGLVLEVEGPSEQVDRFAQRLELERPKPAVVQARESASLPPAGFTDFEIRASDDESEKTAGLVPDLPLCDACRAELFDPTDRRYVYPFINCTNCGPRYSIILDIPYDRCHTTMRDFAFCADCRREYESPGDRRFDAQPNACSVCGPHLEGVTGDIPASGLRLKGRYRRFDAEQRFAVDSISAAEPADCISGLILQGIRRPFECPAFGVRCTPETPIGAPMVSSEGACAAYYLYARR